ncbi:MAG TPA: helix-turn-helix domain-containing protein [Cyclobacteriaceae bacterium]|mgnify:CR=1 FL=1|nr:AraC family transcriptional regulator [Cyclobacteriaceae bacterium]MCB9239067.1 AraC family transcriptional regulator [Flammeovirgaceae bacterium]MCB0498343.1 AraC family transcriptional regulator [Cyclobacteriaceae bacterium]MCO5271093.1 helix-turn-helix domain-containing protein [Cyclobacteriaceae bacterium]MCW5903471.1 AraC family transcriptional regulator [Cyclobacteriaceae bacterium]
MKYRTIQPTKKLSRFVRFYWSLEGSVPNGHPYVHRTLANASPEMIFHYKGSFEELNQSGQTEKTFLTGVHAQTDRVRRFIAKSDYGIFGVYLQPYAIPVLFGVPSSDIKNELPDLTTLLGGEGERLTEKMMLAGSNVQRLQIINGFLEQRLTGVDPPGIVNATHQIFNRNGLVNVKNLAAQSSLSQRQFERKFKEFIGFTPKSFSKVVRFNALLWNYKRPNASLTEMAYDFDYYDQAHFIQDFKQFSGYNPKTYFSGKAKEVFYAP